MTYPRLIRAIHQIEVTTRCNLKCVYCPSPNLPRPKMDMTPEVFERAVCWAADSYGRNEQGELALTGIGEPLLHPKFANFLLIASAMLPETRITFSTNGLLITEDFCKMFAARANQIRVYVSLHKPERATPAMHLLAKYGLLADANVAFSISSFDWAGQLKWPVSAPKIPCEYLRSGWGVVLVDGRITTCCLDASGAGVVGTVFDEPGSLSIKPYSLCESCHMEVP